MLKALPEQTKVRGDGSLLDERIQEMLIHLSPCAREEALETLVELLVSQQISSCSQESIVEQEP